MVETNRIETVYQSPQMTQTAVPSTATMPMVEKVVYVEQPQMTTGPTMPQYQVQPQYQGQPQAQPLGTLLQNPICLPGGVGQFTSGMATGTGLMGPVQHRTDWIRKDRKDFLETHPPLVIQQPVPQPVIVERDYILPPGSNLQTKEMKKAEDIQQPQPTEKIEVTKTETAPLLMQQPLPQPAMEPIATTGNIIEERPVLDRVEKLLHKEVIHRPVINEQVRQDIIEVHEKPIEKRFIHPVQELHVKEESKFEELGKDIAEMERNRVLSQIREQDRLRKVQVDQHQDVRVINDAPQRKQSREIRKEIIYKPIVTEIHEQPIREIHEQEIIRTIYEKPIITVVREQKIIENMPNKVSYPLGGLEQSQQQSTYNQQGIQGGSGYGVGFQQYTGGGYMGPGMSSGFGGGGLGGPGLGGMSSGIGGYNLEGRNIGGSSLGGGNIGGSNLGGGSSLGGGNLGGSSLGEKGSTEMNKTIMEEKNVISEGDVVTGGGSKLSGGTSFLQPSSDVGGSSM
jgi:hypothetical protein